MMRRRDSSSKLLGPSFAPQHHHQSPCDSVSAPSQNPASRRIHGHIAQWLANTPSTRGHSRSGVLAAEKCLEAGPARFNLVLCAN